MVLSRRVFVWAGLSLIALGASLPWVTRNPRSEVDVLVYVAGMGSGAEIWGLVTLPLAVVAFVGTMRELRWLSTHTFRTFVGAGAVGFALYSVTNSPGLSGVFVPASGAFVTLVGGLVVLITSRRPIVIRSFRSTNAVTGR